MPDVKNPGDEKQQEDFEIPLPPKPEQIKETEGAPEKSGEVLPSPEMGQQEDLRAKIEAMDLDDATAAQATQTAQSLQGAGQEEKIKKLLLLAQEKGVIYAVNVAKKMDDAYILDMFHDALAKEGLYAKFKE